MFGLSSVYIPSAINFHFPMSLIRAKYRPLIVKTNYLKEMTFLSSINDQGCKISSGLNSIAGMSKVTLPSNCENVWRTISMRPKWFNFETTMNFLLSPNARLNYTNHMNDSHPSINSLITHLQKAPAFFFNDKAAFPSKIIGDVLENYGFDRETERWVKRYNINDSAGSNHARIGLLVAWLLTHEWFETHKEQMSGMMGLFLSGFSKLSALVDAKEIITEEERSEELVRLCLTKLEILPAGEDLNSAQLRLNSINTVKQGKKHRPQTNPAKKNKKNISLNLEAVEDLINKVAGNVDERWAEQLKHSLQSAKQNNPTAHSHDIDNLRNFIDSYESNSRLSEDEKRNLRDLKEKAKSSKKK